MGEIRIKNAPEELKLQLKSEAKRLGMDVRAVMLMRLWGIGSAPYEGAAKGSSETPTGTAKGSVRPPLAKFAPPTVAEVLAYVEESKSAVDGRAFWNYYESQGWRVGKNPMKNWKAAVGTWARNPEQGRLSYAQQRGEQQVSPAAARSQRIKQNILDGFGITAGKGTEPDGPELEDGASKRTDG